eukprot:2168182-Amphidinium_carterae.1
MQSCPFRRLQHTLMFHIGHPRVIGDADITAGRKHIAPTKKHTMAKGDKGRQEEMHTPCCEVSS